MVLPDPGGPNSRVILWERKEREVEEAMKSSYKRPGSKSPSSNRYSTGRASHLFGNQKLREIFSPARFDDTTDVVEDGHGPLPVGEYAQRVRRFLNQTTENK